MYVLVLCLNTPENCRITILIFLYLIVAIDLHSVHDFLYLSPEKGKTENQGFAQ